MGWVAGSMIVAGLVAARVVLDLLQPKCKPKYGVHNKTIIVTGGNSGIGYELGRFGYHVSSPNYALPKWKSLRKHI